MKNEKMIKRAKGMNIQKYITPNESLIHGSRHSIEGLFVPEIIMKYGDNNRNFSEMKTMMPTMMKTLHNIKKSYSSVKKNPKDSKDKITPEFLEKLKQYTIDLGCNGIGFTKVDRDLIFKDRGILYDNAIVVTMEMRQEPIARAPGLETHKEIFRTYLGLGIVVNKIAKYLRYHGYKAQAGPALGGDVNYPLLAEKAGLGAIGKHGLLISPGCGPRQRIAAVYTNIKNLPIANENPHLWIKEFCQKCGKCSRKCPASAIYQETIDHDDGTETHIDYKKCAVPFSNSYGCTICIKECVFNHTDYDKLKNSQIS